MELEQVPLRTVIGKTQSSISWTDVAPKIAAMRAEAREHFAQTPGAEGGREVTTFSNEGPETVDVTVGKEDHGCRICCGHRKDLCLIPLSLYLPNARGGKGRPKASVLPERGDNPPHVVPLALQACHASSITLSRPMRVDEAI